MVMGMSHLLRFRTRNGHDDNDDDYDDDDGSHTSPESSSSSLVSSSLLFRSPSATVATKLASDVIVLSAKSSAN